MSDEFLPESAYAFLDAAAVKEEPEPAEQLGWRCRKYTPPRRKTGKITAEERCEKYLEKVDPGVEGQNGSCPMFRAACVIVRFGITDRPTAFRLLSEYGSRCTPPWTDEAQINHKLDDAYKDELRRDFVDQDPPEWAGCGEESPNGHTSSSAVDPSTLADSVPITDEREKRFANFKARIVREIVRHEAGGEITRHVEVEATHDDGTVAIVTVAAEDFESMTWVPTQLGMNWILKVGRNVKDRFQHHIRETSYRQPVTQCDVFTSLGWHDVDGKNVYLHAGGAIGADGKSCIRVDVGHELTICRLPPPDLKGLKEATQRVLMIPDNLGIQAEPIAAVLVSLPYRAILGPSRTVSHLAGTTGTYKTSAASIAMRFYAPTLEYSDSMPLSWQSTQAGLEWIRHTAKDILLVVDNLIADGDQAHKDLAKADAVINSQGDLAGKARMGRDRSSLPALDPRGSIISTGECEPRRKSSVGRSLILETRPGLINFDGLTRCHDDARAGHYALTISCYAEYLAAPGRLESQRAELRRLSNEHREAAAKLHQGCHPRHAEAVGEWTAGLQLFLRFAVEHKAIGKLDAELFLNRMREQLFRTLPMQASIQEESDPGDMFIDMIRSLLGCKRAVLSDPEGQAPDIDPERCGWQRLERADRNGNGTIPGWDLASGAVRIGWVDGEMVYLDPNVSHAVAERFAREVGQTLGSKRQVCARLAETDRIKTEQGQEGERRRYTMRVSVEKVRRYLLCMPVNVLFQAKPEKAPTEEARNDGVYY